METIASVFLIIFFVSMFWTLIAILAKKKYKIPLIILGVSILALLIFVPRDKQEEPKQQALTVNKNEPEGISIVGKTEGQRMAEALAVINQFLSAINNDNFESAYNLLSPEYYNLFSLNDFKNCVKKEYFVKQLDRTHYEFNNFDDHRSSGDNVWFEVPKDLLPKLYFNITMNGVEA